MVSLFFVQPYTGTIDLPLANAATSLKIPQQKQYPPREDTDRQAIGSLFCSTLSATFIATVYIQ